MKSGPCPGTAPAASLDSDVGVAWLGADTEEGAGAGNRDPCIT